MVGKIISSSAGGNRKISETRPEVNLQYRQLKGLNADYYQNSQASSWKPGGLARGSSIAINGELALMQGREAPDVEKAVLRLADLYRTRWEKRSLPAHL